LECTLSDPASCMMHRLGCTSSSITSSCLEINNSRSYGQAFGIERNIR
jgi:hypothetical protein